MPGEMKRCDKCGFRIFTGTLCDRCIIENLQAVNAKLKEELDELKEEVRNATWDRAD